MTKILKIIVFTFFLASGIFAFQNFKSPDLNVQKKISDSHNCIKNKEPVKSTSLNQKTDYNKKFCKLNHREINE